jgi:hypothetical protein
MFSVDFGRSWKLLNRRLPKILSLLRMPISPLRRKRSMKLTPCRSRSQQIQAHPGTVQFCQTNGLLRVPMCHSIGVHAAWRRIGSLIAPPLQKQPKDPGNSVFVDDNIVPHVDRRLFLRSAFKLPRIHVEAVVRECSQILALDRETVYAMPVYLQLTVRIASQFGME